MRKFFLPFVALAGLLVAIGVVVMGNQPVEPSVPAVQAAQAPFSSYIASAGLVESRSENIAIGTPVAGVVSEIFVSIGDQVEANEPLFRIDDRDLQAQLLPAEASVAVERGILAKAITDLEIAEGVTYELALSRVNMLDRRADVVIGEATVALAEAQVQQLRMEIDRRTIRAPIAGEVLQIKTHLGEFARGNSATGLPLMTLGDTFLLHVRADIDEYDAWRLAPDRPAVAFMRGNPAVEIPLTFVRIEPYVVPKRSLTGNSAERTDTRVLQVIYSFDAIEVPLYIGQQLDIYIEAPSVGEQ